MLSLILALAAQVAASTPGRPAPPGTDFAGLPVEAADHEAVVLINPGQGPHVERRLALVRSGRRLREEFDVPEGHVVRHSDFDAAVTFSYYRGEGARIRGMGISRARAGSDGLLRERTERRDRALGEVCEIWRITPAREAANRLVGTESCETADGIQLWTRSIFPGGSTEHSRTISFRRRPVAPGEVRPARALLRWSEWRDLPPLSPAPARGPRGYDLRLEALQHNGVERLRILRRGGNWTYYESVRHDGSRSVSMDNRAMTLRYEIEGDGRPVELSLQLVPAEQARMVDNHHYERLRPEQSENVLGEICHYSQQAGEGAVVITSGVSRECVTDDGLLLRAFSHHRVLYTDITATVVRRTAPSLADMMPPRELFEWRVWGLQPAD